MLDDGDQMDAFDRHPAFWIASDAEGLCQIVLGDRLGSRAMAHRTRFRPPGIDAARIKARATALVAGKLEFEDIRWCRAGDFHSTARAFA